MLSSKLLFIIATSTLLPNLVVNAWNPCYDCSQECQKGKFDHTLDKISVPAWGSIEFTSYRNRNHNKNGRYQTPWSVSFKSTFNKKILNTHIVKPPTGFERILEINYANGEWKKLLLIEPGIDKCDVEVTHTGSNIFGDVLDVRNVTQINIFFVKETLL